MWISDRGDGPARPAAWMSALEALGLAAAFGLLPELIWARSIPPRGPHPVWIAVLILSTRYAGPGFFVGLTAAAAALGLAGALAGTGPAIFMGRLESWANVVALGACLAVSWVASCHTHRQTVLLGKLQALADRAARAESTVQTLHGLVGALRRRVDRTSASLGFLRDVASRLEGTDAVTAAEGAADLALARTGAAIVALRATAGGAEPCVVVRDARGFDAPAPADLRGAEVSVPVLAGGERVGVIELWGIPGPGLGRAEEHDLAVIASWCGPALASVGRRWEQAEAIAGVQEAS